MVTSVTHVGLFSTRDFVKLERRMKVKFQPDVESEKALQSFQSSMEKIMPSKESKRKVRDRINAYLFI